MVLGQLNIHVQKNDTDLTPFTKINSKWITDLYVKRKTIKFLEDSIGEKLDDIEYEDDFLDTTPKPCSIKEITDNLNIIKVKSRAIEKTMPRKLEDYPQSGRKHSQKPYLIKDYYQKYTENS